jgi:hypothetical protein
MEGQEEPAAKQLDGITPRNTLIGRKKLMGKFIFYVGFVISTKGNRTFTVVKG